MQLTEMKYTNGNRKEEYKKIAEIFSKCPTIEEAHKLSAVVLEFLNQDILKAILLEKQKA